MLFKYEAKTYQGETKNGTIEASSQSIAVDILQKSDLILLDIVEASDISLATKKLKFFEHIPKKEVFMFSRQLSVLFEAKVPVVESLRTMIDQTRSVAFKEILEKVTKSVNDGNPLSKSFAEHKKVFSDFYISIVKSGELSGNLETVFSYLAESLERDYYLTQKVRGAMIYPAFIIFAMIAVTFVMMIWVIPNLTSVFTESNMELPFLTQIIVNISDVFQEFWWLILFVLVGGATGFWQWVSTENGKMIWGSIQLEIPVFGEILTKFYLARFSDSLSTLIVGGLPIVKSLETSADVVGNYTYKKILRETIDVVKKGGTISSVFRRYKEVPIMVTQMISIGEQAGKLDGTLKTISKFYSKEVESAMDNMVTLIEPLLILVLGTGVGILIVAILMPMYNLTAAI
ncbi:MAG: type II secretion system F family protein [Patescibacteria group bacterium]